MRTESKLNLKLECVLSKKVRHCHFDERSEEKSFAFVRIIRFLSRIGGIEMTEQCFQSELEN